MKSFIKYLTIDEEYIFAGDRKKLINILQESRIVNFKLIDHTEIKLYPDISWGTMVFKGGIRLVDGINVRVKTSALGLDSLKVNFRTRLRPEHYFMLAFFIFFITVTILSNGPGLSIVYLLGLWIISHIWFHYIYRRQENLLIEKVIGKLKLVKM